jgi:excisionase family DNA binding protein
VGSVERRSGFGLLGPEEVARLVGVKETTVWRRCREGRLPCLKVGKHWRIRRAVLEDFPRESERPRTLVGQLGSFLRVPDKVLVVAEDVELLHRLDAAFFRVAEARGGLLVKFDQDGPSALPCAAERIFMRHHDMWTADIGLGMGLSGVLSPIKPGLCAIPQTGSAGFAFRALGWMGPPQTRRASSCGTIRGVGGKADAREAGTPWCAGGTSKAWLGPSRSGAPSSR